jgi:hypothetical protein
MDLACLRQTSELTASTLHCRPSYFSLHWFQADQLSFPPTCRWTTAARFSACASSAHSAAQVPSWPPTGTVCTAASAPPPSCTSRWVTPSRTLLVACRAHTSDAATDATLRPSWLWLQGHDGRRVSPLLVHRFLVAPRSPLPRPLLPPLLRPPPLPSLPRARRSRHPSRHVLLVSAPSEPATSCWMQARLAMAQSSGM